MKQTIKYLCDLKMVIPNKKLFMVNIMVQKIVACSVS